MSRWSFFDIRNRHGRQQRNRCKAAYGRLVPVQIYSIKAVAAAIVLLGAITVSHAETASVHISVLKTKSAEGTGSLFFHARRYRLRISGIDTKPANVEKIELAGTASGLQSTGDIVGSYGPAASGTAIVSGAKAARLQNGGVILELHANNVEMSAIDLAGMTISSHGWRAVVGRGSHPK
jgi:hypothetical protein